MRMCFFCYNRYLIIRAISGFTVYPLKDSGERAERANDGSV